MSSTTITDDFSSFDEEDSFTSRVKFQTYKLEWTIKDFEFILTEMQIIESPKFPAKKSKQGQWFIKLLPLELNKDNEERFCLHLYGTDKTKRYITVRLSLLNSTGDKIDRFGAFRKCSYPRVWSVDRTKIQELFSDESKTKTLKLICKLRVFDSVNNTYEKLPIDCEESESLLQQLDKFYCDQFFKDVTFIVQEKEIQAHQAILSFRSPVFAGMFQNKMSEEFISTVKIEDISSTIFEKMLRFIYTDKVENLEQIAFEMLYAAEKYELEKLKKMCINSLYKNISLETVVSTLELADLYSLSELKQKSMKFLISNFAEITETEEYVKLMKERSHLIVQITQVMNIVNNDHEEAEDCSVTSFFSIREKSDD